MGSKGKYSAGGFKKQRVFFGIGTTVSESMVIVLNATYQNLRFILNVTLRETFTTPKAHA
jgi:hypothetical protein